MNFSATRISDGKKLKKTATENLLSTVHSVKQAEKIVKLMNGYRFIKDEEKNKIKVLKQKAEINKIEKRNAEILKKKAENAKNTKNFDTVLRRALDNDRYFFKEIGRKWIRTEAPKRHHSDIDFFKEIGRKWIRTEEAPKRHHRDIDGKINKGRYFISFLASYIPKERDNMLNVIGSLVHDEKTIYHMLVDDGGVSQMNVTYNVNVTKNNTSIRRIVDEACHAFFYGKRMIASGIIIEGITHIIIKKGKNVKFTTIVMRKQNLAMKIVGNIEKINKHDGQCVIDYVMYEMQHTARWTQVKRPTVEQYFNKDGSGTIQQIVDMAGEMNNIRVDVLHPMGHTILKYLPEKKTTNNMLHLCFIMNNNHCYPIISKEAKEIVSRKGRLDLGEMIINFDCSDYVFMNAERVLSKQKELINGTFKTDKKYILIENVKPKYEESKVVHDGYNINDMANDIIRATGFIIEKIKFRGAN